MTLLETVLYVVAESTGHDLHEIELYHNLQTDLGADSLDIAQIVNDLEKEHNIEISTETAKRFLTVNDVVEYLEVVKG